MARRVFFSFHYQRDIWRVNQIRNCWVTRGVNEAGFWDNSLWEATKSQGDIALRNLIDTGFIGTSVTVVLIGAETANRKWVKYEIQKSRERGNGMIGIYIHNVRNQLGQYDIMGTNPFDQFTALQMGTLIRYSQLYRTYNWTLEDGYNNIGTWIERAAILAKK